MLGPILETIIGLVFIYLLLSIMCSALSEVIASLLGLRAQTLERGVQNLLKDGKLSKSVYGHHFVSGLTHKGWLKEKLNLEAKPSYIPSSIFAEALLDKIAELGREGKGRTIDSSISPQAYAENIFKEIVNGVAKIKNPEIREVLTSLIVSARIKTDTYALSLEAARESIEQWFNESMDALSYLYKRKIQLILIGIATVLVLILNANTFTIVNNLSRDTALRAAIVAAATEVVKSPDSSNPSIVLAKDSEIQKALQQYVFPLNCRSAPESPNNLQAGKKQESSYSALLFWLLSSSGLLITVLAISLGAPFWFDVLNRVVNLRESGKQNGSKSSK